nr:uncharacterized mitochondrial protein AtMg00810-like [Tanacetum cinerariifolium]
METMNVTFDELLAMAFEQSSSKLGLQSKTPGQISSGLDLTYAPSTITTQQPTKGDLDLLFDMMYDDYIDNITPLTLKWLFKNKHDEENMIIRNKTRLVVRGYRLEEGIELKESFALVARMEAIRQFLDSGFKLTGFLAADYVGCKDTFKSTSSGTQFLGKKLVSWSSKKQDCMVLSTAKAEYVSLSTCCAQVI